MKDTVVSIARFIIATLYSR